VLIITEAGRIVGVQAWAEQDARGAVVAALAPYRDRLDVVNVDAAGIGHYLVKYLRELGFPVRPVNVGERSSDHERYPTLTFDSNGGSCTTLSPGSLSVPPSRCACQSQRCCWCWQTAH
jgi:hypothetical protein